MINSETEDIAKRVKEITGLPVCLHTTLHQTSSMLSNSFHSTANESSLCYCETIALTYFMIAGLSLSCIQPVSLLACVSYKDHALQ